MQSSELTPQERRLELVLRLFSLLFAGFAVSYLLQGALNDETEFPFVANSVAKDGMFAILAFIAAGDIRKNGWAGQIVIVGHVLIVGTLLYCLIFGNTESVRGSFGEPAGIGLPSAKALLFVWLGLASFVVALLAFLYRSAARSRYRLSYLAPHQHRTAMALAEVIVTGPDELLTPEEVAAGIDDYLSSFRARQKWKSKLALSALTVYPLLRFRPPYPLMSPERRLEFIERCFLRDVAERRLPGPLRKLVQSMLFAAQQLTFIGYYSDERTAAATGYVPFSKRPRYPEMLQRVEPRAPLDVRTPNEVDAEIINADVAIIGSGAAGAILAHRLAERGREVLVLERGRHVDPSEFSENERRQFSDLYADGAMQMSKDARFQVLQGMCVGGTTVVNNAVCFDIPPASLDRWNDPDGLDAGVDEDRLAASFARVRDWLPVTSQGDNPYPGPGSLRFVEGIERLGLEGTHDVVDANIADCLGCGYCNYGCAFGKKLSALDTILPRAQREFGTDAVRILAECEAERIRTRHGSRSVDCRLSDGRKVEVRANTVVVSGGALASSLLLARSGLGNGNAGRHLGFNLGAPVSADFPEQVNGYDGLQISHFLQPNGDDQLILETWFNPVGAQALFMPGWFSDHYENMRRYSHMACGGSVVGTQRNAHVKPGFRGKGMKLDYEPASGDLTRLVAGMKTLGRIYLAAGAERVLPTTFRYMQLRSEPELDQLDEIRDNTDIQLHSSHPQGGNAISRDPRKGVVGPDFAVHGAEGVYCCDASVFPAPITVNPQLTVMALADLAAPGID